MYIFKNSDIILDGLPFGVFYQNVISSYMNKEVFALIKNNASLYWLHQL